MDLEEYHFYTIRLKPETWVWHCEILDTAIESYTEYRTSQEAEAAGEKFLRDYETDLGLIDSQQQELDANKVMIDKLEAKLQEKDDFIEAQRNEIVFAQASVAVLEKAVKAAQDMPF